MSTNPHRRLGRVIVKTAGLLLVSLVILVGAASVGRGLPGEFLDRFSELGAPATLTDLTSVDQLRSAFNQADGTPRLILLFSPT